MEEIKYYLIIVLPAYKFSIGMQRSKSHIGEVIPGLLKCLTSFELD